MHKIIQLFFATLFFISMGKENVVAQNSATEKLSITAMIDSIIKLNPSIIMYDAKIKSIHAQTEGAKSWMPPTFSFGLNKFPYQSSILKEKAPMNQAGLMFTLQQMIPNSSKLNAKKSYLQSLTNVQQNNSEWQKNVLLSAAKIYYYQRYVSEKKMKIVDDDLGILNLLINTAEGKYAYNQADLNSIFKAKAKREELVNMKTMLQSQIAESNIAINILMNRDVNTVFEIDTTIAVKDYSQNINVRADSSLLKRNDILAMQNSIASMELNKNLMSLGRKPDFGVSVSHGQMFGMANQYSLMGMMTIPIAPWSSKMYKSEVKSMGFEIEAMQKEKENMQLMAAKMIAEKRTMLNYQVQQYKNYGQNIVPAYQKNFETSLLSYKQNTGNFFILLDAWDMLLMKQIEQLDKLNEALKLQSEYEYEIEKR
jgi:cobalt-zinc-cadmium efflux system outer membrane protein